MRTNVLLFLCFAVICSCGDKAEQKATDSRPSNLFSIAVNSKAEVNRNIVLGLWESTPYLAEDATKQLRWLVAEDQMTLAKQCTYLGKIYVAQVSMPIVYAPAQAVVNENGSLNRQAYRITANQVDFPKPQVVAMKDGKTCEVALLISKGADGNYFIEDDKEFIFSGEINDGAIELQLISDGTLGNFRKIQD